MMKLSTCLIQFFDRYLRQIKGSSEQTVRNYRDTFSLFLPFAAQYYGLKIESLQLDHLNPEVIIAFLNHLESGRQNKSITRNNRLAALKSMARMIRLMYPQKGELAQRISSIPRKNTQKQLIGFLYPEEILQVFQAVDLKKNQGFRDYCLLHLLYDSGARAGEAAALNLDYFNPQQKTLAILGKGNRFRLIELWPKTNELITEYMAKYRARAKPQYQHRLFINQRGKGFTRHGIYRICKKYLDQALPPKRMLYINPAHSFRHSCAVRMLAQGKDITEIKNRLGHENIQSTMTYLQLDLASRREIQKKFIQYTQSFLTHDPKIDELIDWENKEDILAWLDGL